MTAAPKRLLVLFVFLAAATGGYLWAHRNEETTDDAAIEANVVPIASKLAGYVTQLNIIDNQHVKKGDALLTIDPRDYENALTAAKAQLDAALAVQVRAAADLKRMQDMHDLARSRQMLDNAIADAKRADANVAEATANEAQAEKNLADTKLVAPFDGYVTNRTVEPGAYAQPGQELMMIVSDDIWVVANYKETQLTRMKPGQPVSIAIDAYPGKIYKGVIDSIQSGTGARFSAFPPENATGNFVKIVQRVPVKILFTEKPEPSLAAGPGLSVNPTVTLQ